MFVDVNQPRGFLAAPVDPDLLMRAVRRLLRSVRQLTPSQVKLLGLVANALRQR